jgi:hypothetical protein
MSPTHQDLRIVSKFDKEAPGNPPECCIIALSLVPYFGNAPTLGIYPTQNTLHWDSPLVAWNSVDSFFSFFFNNPFWGSLVTRTSMGRV